MGANDHPEAPWATGALAPEERSDIMNMRLLVVQGKPAGKSLHFGPGDYILGRGRECHVRFSSEWVSHQHCQLKVGVSQVSIRDLGSRNGTLLNGHLLQEEEVLREADQIQIGPVVFEVHFDPLPDSETGPTPPHPGLIRSTDSDRVPSDPELPLTKTREQLDAEK